MKTSSPPKNNVHFIGIGGIGMSALARWFKAHGYLVTGSDREKSSTTDTLSKRLEDIDTALLNLENNTYGVCTMCGMKIEEDRLDANPAAQTCKMCMNKIA